MIPSARHSQTTYRSNEHFTAAMTLAHLRSKPPGMPAADFSIASASSSPRTLNVTLTRMSFPLKLFEILDQREHKDILRWIPNGKAFIIVDKERLTKEILPLYFKKSQYANFDRTLTRWKFTRILKGSLAGAYYNKFFRRDFRDLCALMAHNVQNPKETTESLLSKLTVRRLKWSIVKSHHLHFPPSVGILTETLQFSMPSPKPVPTRHRCIEEDQVIFWGNTAHSRSLLIQEGERLQRNIYNAPQMKTLKHDDSNVFRKGISDLEIIAEAWRVLEKSFIMEHGLHRH